MNHHWMAIGVDVGTTKTVVAYALLHDQMDLWIPPDAHDWIIPTAVDYDEIGQTIWGNTAASRPDPQVWFKLLIHSSPVVDLREDNLVGAIGGTMGRDTAGKLIGDFLNVLQQKLLAHFQRYGPAQIEWCFTEPGCWNDQGRLDFRTAIQDRMFNGHACDVSFVSEAEAAAEYTALEGANRGLVQQGDVVMVCDCGGATTDVAILRVNGTNPFTSQPVGDPASFRLGAVDIDAALMEQVRQAYWESDQGLRRGAPAAEARREISRVKENFTGGPGNVPIYIQGPERGVIMHQFTHDDLINAFEPTVEGIIDVIIQKILSAGAKVTKVVLVGGLGKSEYLRSRVRHALHDVYVDTPPKLVDALPDTIRSAVACGAVLRAQRVPPVRWFESRSQYELCFPSVDVYGDGMPDKVLTNTIIARGRRDVPASGSFIPTERMRLVPQRMGDRFLQIRIVRQAETLSAAVERVKSPANVPFHWANCAQGMVHKYPLRVFWSIHLGSAMFIHWRICIADGQDRIETVLAESFREVSPQDLILVVNG